MSKQIAWRSFVVTVAGLFLVAGFASAALTMLEGTTITSVAVNGGSDVANPGTSCIQVANPISASCSGGYVAIPNNNKLLIAAALSSKALGNPIWLYYEDAAGTNHCPGRVFTACTVISIQAK